MSVIHKIAALLLFWSISLSGVAQQFVIGRHADSPPLDKCFEVVTRAYLALNIDYVVIEYPGRRSLHMANTGKIDAELCRIKEITTEFNGLIALEPGIANISIVGISLKDFRTLSGISDLKEVLIGSRRGIQAVELLLNEHKIHYETESSVLFRLLREGILDLALLPRNEFTKRNEYRESFKVQPNIEFNFKLHHFIHKQHADLGKPLSRQLEKQLNQLAN